MKLGIFDPYLDDLGGGEKYMMTIAECLSENHEVTVFWDNKEDLEQLQQRFSLNLGKVRLAHNIFSPKFNFLQRLREMNNYDVIIVLSDGSIPLCSSKKLFLHIQQPLAQSDTSILKQLKLRRVSSIFYNSEFTKSFNNKFFSRVSSAVIYPPVEIQKKDMNKENIILHVGRFRVKKVKVDDYKKQGVMIEAFKKMHTAGLKGWRFVIAGGVQEKDSEEFKALQQRAEGFPIEFLINKKNAELWDVYNKAKIYWHASGFGEDLEQHPEYAEHFGISTVEAMGAGVVPVVINAGGQKELVTDALNGFVWNTLEELEEKTRLIINDEELREKLSGEAMKKAAEFSKERFGKAISELIAQ